MPLAWYTLGLTASGSEHIGTLLSPAHATWLGESYINSLTLLHPPVPSSAKQNTHLIKCIAMRIKWGNVSKAHVGHLMVINRRQLDTIPGQSPISSHRHPLIGQTLHQHLIPVENFHHHCCHYLGCWRTDNPESIKSGFSIISFFITSYVIMQVNFSFEISWKIA